MTYPGEEVVRASSLHLENQSWQLSTWHESQTNETGARGVSKRMNGPWTARGACNDRDLQERMCNYRTEFKNWPRRKKSGTSAGISLMGEKDVYILKQRMRSGPHRWELFHGMREKTFERTVNWVNSQKNTSTKWKFWLKISGYPLLADDFLSFL